MADTSGPHMASALMRPYGREPVRASERLSAVAVRVERALELQRGAFALERR